ncbi:MAG: hypothetical protein LBI82_06955 [Dysgonamonadaceae bacterium]|jgi:hypothetical protein|nr:hypothetical protein [Dysgonamonadaceae bacterium]
MNIKLSITKKVIFTFFALFITSMSINAQSNFRLGYIITNQQDTITGWINLQTDKNNQKQCEFKTNLESTPKVFLPGDIAGYRFAEEGKYYVSREVQLNGTPQKVFLEFLVKGIMNLYYYTDDVNYYFFENQDEKMETISQQPEKIENTGIRGIGKKIVRKDMRYIGQVRYLFRDYQPIVQKANDLNFDQKSMMGIVEEYHNEVCTTGESCIIFKNEHPDDFGWRFKFSVYTGLQLSNYTFNKITSIPPNFKYATFTQNNVSPVFGLQINFANPRISKSFSSQLDISLSQFKGDVPNEINRRVRLYQNGVFNQDAVRATSYKALASSFRLGVKYTYPKYRISPTVEAGIAYTLLKEDQEILRHNHYGYYLAAGANYNIKTSQSVFIRLVYENYLSLDNTQKYSKDKICIPHAKIGYIF